jgi:DNA gyrase inhibitor GyrI
MPKFKCKISDVSMGNTDLESHPAKLQRINKLTAVYVHAKGLAPEENAFKKIMHYAKESGLTQIKNTRLFGRNTYPTEAPEPHGYEYYLTTQKKDIKPSKEIEIEEIPAGLYAVLEFKSLDNLHNGWKQLFAWVKAQGYEATGVTRKEHGWVRNAFEELVNWKENKAPRDWIFHLWVQLKE